MALVKNDLALLCFSVVKMSTRLAVEKKRGFGLMVSAWKCPTHTPQRLSGIRERLKPITFRRTRYCPIEKRGLGLKAGAGE